MTSALADGVPEPVRAPGVRPRLWSRVATAVVLGVLATALAFFAATLPGPMSAAGIGRAARVPMMQPWSPRVDWFRRRVVDTIPLARIGMRPPVAADEVWLSFPEEPRRERRPGPSIEARCGCRYVPSRAARHGPCVVYVWQSWPRDEPEVRIALGTPRETFAIELPPGSAAPAPPPREIVALPWEGTAGGSRIRLARRNGKIRLSFPRPEPGRRATCAIVFRDAVGNTVEASGDPAHDVDWSLPFGTLLCPHAGWCEMTFVPLGPETVTVRFRTSE